MKSLWGNILQIRSIIVLSKLIARQDLTDFILFRPNLRRNREGDPSSHKLFFAYDLKSNVGSPHDLDDIEISEIKQFPGRIDKNGFSYVVGRIADDFFGFRMPKEYLLEFQVLENLIEVCLEEIGEYLESLRRRLEHFKDNQEFFDSGIVTVDPKMKYMIKNLPQISRSGAFVHLQGDAGVGKDSLASYFHFLSFSEGNLVEVNCDELTEKELESEICGHAFKPGADIRGAAFNRAENGTIHLKEVQTLGKGLQWKLVSILRNIVNRKEPYAKCKIVTSSTEDIQVLTGQGLFLSELYYLLSVVEINIPSLRDRPDDILPLTYRVMDKELERNDKRAISLHPDAEAILNFYDWPGNLHELYREISRFISNSSSFNQIEPKHLSSYILHSMRQKVIEKNDWVKVGCYSGLTVEVFDKALVEKALDQFSWDQEFTSDFLSLTVDQLDEKIKELKIEKRQKTQTN